MTYNGQPKVLTYKKLVEFIADIQNEHELNEACALIDFSYQHEKITYKDSETLYKIIGKLK